MNFKITSSRCVPGIRHQVRKPWWEQKMLFTRAYRVVWDGKKWVFVKNFHRKLAFCSHEKHDRKLDSRNWGGECEKRRDWSNLLMSQIPLHTLASTCEAYSWQCHANEGKARSVCIGSSRWAWKFAQQVCSADFTVSGVLNSLLQPKDHQHLTLCSVGSSSVDVLNLYKPSKLKFILLT